MQRFGLKAPDGVNGPVWGARAIYKLGSVTKKYNRVVGRRIQVISQTGAEASVDLLWDRQRMVDGDETSRKALGKWIDGNGMKLLKKALVDCYITGNIDQEVRVEDEGFIMIANPRKSYGYLYMCAWRAKQG